SMQYLAGVNFEMSNLLRGEIGVGHVSVEYDNAAFPDADGFSANARLEWFPDPLVTVTATAARDIEESGISASPGIFSDSASIAVDYEIRRSVILGIEVSCDRNDYEVLDRVDEAMFGRIRADYVLNRVASLNFGVTYEDVQSDGIAAGRDYNATRFGV